MEWQLLHRCNKNDHRVMFGVCYQIIIEEATKLKNKISHVFYNVYWHDWISHWKANTINVLHQTITTVLKMHWNNNLFKQCHYHLLFHFNNTKRKKTKPENRTKKRFKISTTIIKKRFKISTTSSLKMMDNS